MVRVALGGLVILAVFAASVLTAADNAKKAKGDKTAKGSIMKVDAKTGTVTMKVKDKDGNEKERTFKLAEDIRYFDSTGKAVQVDLFRSGDYVLVVEHEGMLKEIRQDKGQKKTPAQK